MVYKKEYEYSPEIEKKLLADLQQDLDKECVKKLIGVFYDAGLPIKIKHLFPDTPNAYYRVLGFVKKSAETVIINTRTDLGKEGVINGMAIQVRVDNKSTFDRLGQFTENIRSQFLDADNCRFCSEKCEGKRYVFPYDGVEYTKCRYLCSNFRLTVQDTTDIDDILNIIRNEISRKKEK